MNDKTPYLLVRLDLRQGAVFEAQRLLHPLEDGATKALLAEALAHAVAQATGYRLYFADDSSEAPAPPARATLPAVRSPFTAARKSSQS